MMKNIIKYGIFTLMSLFILASCDPQDGDDHKLGAEPRVEDLNFTITPSSATPNVLTLQNTSTRTGVVVWDLGNFSKGKGESIEGEYPFKGEYTITMTLYTTGGSVSTSKNITIADNDFDLLDRPIYNALTGGFNNPEGRTWVFDHNEDGHFGVYPNDNSWSWNAGANDKANSSLYTQEFTFSMSKVTGLKLVWKNNGKVYTNDAGRKKLAEMGYTKADHPEGDGDYDVEYTPKESYSFIINGTAKTITLTDDAFFGHFAGTSTYNIASWDNLTDKDNTVADYVFEINCASTVEEGNNWKYRFIPKE